MINIRKLEAELWESADLLRQGSKLTNMAVHGLNGKIVSDDGVDFHERMNEIHTALDQLNKEANVLMDEIQKVWEELK